jgi:hypothetical protein
MTPILWTLTKARALAPLVSEPIDTERYDFFPQRYA